MTEGKPIDARRLSRYLDGYGVARKQVRIGDRTGKGYTRESLHDPWRRYLGEVNNGPETSETEDTNSATCPRCASEGLDGDDGLLARPTTGLASFRK